MTCASTAATCVPRTESASGQAVDLIYCVPTARSCSRVVTWQLPTPQGPASWKAATDLRSLREVGGGGAAGSPPHVCAVPRRHRRGRKAGRPIARPPEGALSAPPHGGLSQVSRTRRAKATASAGPPDSRSGVCCKGAGEMLGPVEALPSLSRKRRATVAWIPALRRCPRRAPTHRGTWASLRPCHEAQV